MNASTLPSRRFLWLVRCGVLLPALSLLVGCGNYGRLSGKVLYKGEPVPKATITFLCDNGRVVVTISDAQGNYKARVPGGMAKISLQNFTQWIGEIMGQMMAKQKDASGSKDAKEGRQSVEDMLKKMGGGGGSGKTIRLPMKANSTELSGLALDVQNGSHEYDIDVKD